MNKQFGYQPGGYGAGGGIDPAIESRVSALENKILKVYYYAEITTISGQISKPQGATILLDQWANGEDALLCKIVGKPDFEATSVFVNSFDVNGNYVISDSLPSNPAALIYVFEISRLNFDLYVDNNYIINYVETGNEKTENKETSGGYAGLSGYAVKFWNAAKTFCTNLIGTATATRNISLPDKDCTLAGLDDIITDHSKLSNLSWINSGHISGQTSERIPSFGTDGNPNLLETIETTFYVGDFTGDFSGLATESNWTDNITALVAGALGDRAIGIGSLGCIYECFYTQYGWARDYINPFITDSALIASLQTSGNWTKVTDTISYYNASTGDRGQRYYANGYNYECINGTAHTWIRIGALDTVEVTDINYIPKPQIEVGKGIGDIITIPAKYDIVSIVAESETTTAGNITIGRTATAEVSSLYITSGCTANGNCQIVLDGITFTVALTTSQNTATSVATAIRATSFVSGSQVWTTGGSGTTVTFTSNKYKAATDATYSDNGTGATGTMTTSTQGVDPNNDIITSTALSTVIGNKKNLTVIKSVDYPTSSAQSIYVNISSVATVKLHFILQKLFE
jgi:hypothetical protein